MPRLFLQLESPHWMQIVAKSCGGTYSYNIRRCKECGMQEELKGKFMFRASLLPVYLLFCKEVYPAFSEPMLSTRNRVDCSSLRIIASLTAFTNESQFLPTDSWEIHLYSHIMGAYYSIICYVRIYFASSLEGRVFRRHRSKFSIG